MTRYNETARITAAVALGLSVAASARAVAQDAPHAVGLTRVAGTVVAREDGAGIVAAQVVRIASGLRTRSDERGLFRIAARLGDTLQVRALGFQERRVVVTTDSISVALTALPLVLPVFTTTVGQRAIRASESPRSVTVVTTHELDAIAAVSVNQALRQIPGLQELPSPPSKTSISIRGFDNARVLVLVDGEPVAGSLTDSRDIGRLSTLATERIEVIKGPSSVEFGSDALGGVINVIQAAPSKRLAVEASGRAGELGRQEASAGVSQQLGAIGYRLSGGWRQSDRVTGYDATGSSFNRVYDVRGDVRLALRRSWQMRLNGTGSQERQRFPVDQQFNGFVDNHGGQGFVELTGSLWNGTLRARSFLQRFNYEYRQSRLLLPIRGSADSLRQQERMARTLLAYTRVLGGHTIDAGLQYSSRVLVAPEKVDGDSARDRLSEAFIRDQWTLGAFFLTVGARYSASSLWGATANPSIGAAWQVAPTLRMRTNLARGFRAPGFKEIRYTFFNPAGGYTLVGNPSLRPETSWSGSFGGNWAPHASLVFDLELYRNDVKDLIDWRFLGNNAAGFQQYANVNVARARTQGVESSVRATWKETSLSFGYDYLHARDLATQLPLSRRATHTSRVTASRDWRWGSGFKSDVSVRYTGNAALVGIPSGAPISGPFSTESGIIGRQGALFSLDGQFRLTLFKSTELSFGVNNALNHVPNLWTPAFARQAYAGMNVRWGG